MTPSTRDRIMSLHRRAYQCSSLDQWYDLAKKLDCPSDVVEQFWKTAQTAKEAGMSKEKAFPLSGEVFKRLDQTCLPGDLVWSRNLAGEVTQGELAEWDNGTAIIKTKDGREKAV